MVQSTTKPSEIQIISTTDDIKKNKVLVKYAFNYNITEKQIEETFIDENENTTTQLVTVYEYYQYISEAEFDLMLKPFITELLKQMYKQLEPVIQERLNLANVEIPKEISIEG